MSQNKIPTDEEIVAGWNFYQTNRKIDRPSLLTLVRQARAAGRAAGREEQREATLKKFQDILIGVNPGEDIAWKKSPLQNPLPVLSAWFFSQNPFEAIRAQGEEKK